MKLLLMWGLCSALQCKNAPDLGASLHSPYMKLREEVPE